MQHVSSCLYFDLISGPACLHILSNFLFSAVLALCMHYNVDDLSDLMLMIACSAIFFIRALFFFFFLREKRDHILDNYKQDLLWKLNDHAIDQISIYVDLTCQSTYKKNACTLAKCRYFWPNDVLLIHETALCSPPPSLYPTYSRTHTHKHSSICSPRWVAHCNEGNSNLTWHFPTHLDHCAALTQRHLSTALMDADKNRHSSSTWRLLKGLFCFLFVCCQEYTTTSCVI